MEANFHFSRQIIISITYFQILNPSLHCVANMLHKIFKLVILKSVTLENKELKNKNLATKG